MWFWRILYVYDSVPRFSLTHRQYFHPSSLIGYFLDLSDLTFSQSQASHLLGVSSTSFKSLAVSFIRFFALWPLGVKYTPEKSRGRLCSLSPLNTHSSRERWHESRDHIPMLWFNLRRRFRALQRVHLRLKATACESTIKTYLGATDPINIFVLCGGSLNGF